MGTNWELGTWYGMVGIMLGIDEAIAKMPC